MNAMKCNTNVRSKLAYVIVFCHPFYYSLDKKILGANISKHV